MVARRFWTIISVLAAGQWGCKPEEEGRASLLSQPRILAVQASPAEAAPGAPVTFDVLRAGPAGRLDVNNVALDFCVERKSIAAPGILAAACLEPMPSAALIPISPVQPLGATVPEDACAIFGPTPPPPAPNQPPLRAVDPDTTGGYYQPVRVVDGDSVSVGSVRLACGLAGTSQENSAAFVRRSHANLNPAVDSVLYARINEEPVILDAATPAMIRPGERVLLAATWQGCSSDQHQCGDGVCALNEDPANCSEDCTVAAICTGAETYVLLDPGANQLSLARETIRVSWYATGGALERDRSGRSSAELASDAQNSWTAPTEPGEYWLFLVIRDDRGGVGWTARSLNVSP